jgi:hypothetical protein
MRARDHEAEQCTRCAEEREWRDDDPCERAKDGSHAKRNARVAVIPHADEVRTLLRTVKSLGPVRPVTITELANRKHRKSANVTEFIDAIDGAPS